MKKNLIIFIIFIFSNVFSQVAQGPAYGVVPGGVAINASMMKEHITSGVVFPKPPRNKFTIPEIPAPPDMLKPLAPEGSNYFEDPIIQSGKNTDSSFIFRSFEGIPQTNSIPPDCYMAVGLNHIITTVNSSFRISDKTGKTLKTISAAQWFSNILSDASPFDPKITYDHFSNRWIMVWLDQNNDKKTSYFLISVSENSNAMGRWWNYLFPGKVNGTNEIQTWADYQGVGYDTKAIYLTANQWYFGGGFDYAKIRIIKKSEIYANNGGAVTFADFWNITVPGYSAKSSYLRPARSYDNDESFYFIAHSPYVPKTFISIFKLTNVLTTPVLTGFNVPVTSYNSAPNANQKDGSTILIEAGGGFIQNEPIFKDGVLHIVHSIASGTGNQYSSVRYLCIEPISKQVYSDVAMGANGYWHFYPALAVDSVGNVVITYSRSGLNEYIGAYYTVKYVDKNTMVGSIPLQVGRANYVKDFNSGRNRWGDYMGAWTDPTDENTLWIFTEYVPSKDTWGTYVGGVRLKPFDNPFISYEQTKLDFGEIEIGNTSLSQFYKIKNFGKTSLQISNIYLNNNAFKIRNNLTFPLNILPFDSLVLEIYFEPNDTGFVYDNLSIVNNSSNNNNLQIELSGKGFMIKPAIRNTIYSILRANNINYLGIINRDGSAELVGPSGTISLASLTINDKITSEQIYGIAAGTSLVRINSLKGDFYKVFDFKTTIKWISFYQGNLYGISDNDNFYLIDQNNGDTTFLFKFKFTPSSFVFDPITGDIWAAVGPSSTVKDKIYKVNPNNGDTTFVGLTGQGIVTNALAFDADNNLYGIRGSAFQNATLFTINKNTGQAFDLKQLAYRGVSTICILPRIGTSVKSDSKTNVALGYFLTQNFPNPFNSSTTIYFTIPNRNNIEKDGLLRVHNNHLNSELIERVTLKIYDFLGREVATLLDSYSVSGEQSVTWNADNYPSGIYFYELRAGSFYSMKKMMLIK